MIEPSGYSIKSIYSTSGSTEIGRPFSCNCPLLRRNNVASEQLVEPISSSSPTNPASVCLFLKLEGGVSNAFCLIVPSGLTWTLRITNEEAKALVLVGAIVGCELVVVVKGLVPLFVTTVLEVTDTLDEVAPGTFSVELSPDILGDVLLVVDRAVGIGGEDILDLAVVSWAREELLGNTTELEDT